MPFPMPPLPEGIEPIPIDKTPEDIVAELEAQIEAAEATPEDTEALDLLEQQLAIRHALNEVAVAEP
jgi:hypothetical protein